MDDLVVMGVGELGKLFAGAALAEGMRVTPIVRAASPARILAALPERVPVLVAVGEDALGPALEALPAVRRDDAILLQNELWPELWVGPGFSPSLLLPWVLQKPGVPRIVVGTTPVFGRHAPLLARLCERLALPWAEIAAAELPQALADKYTFILVINALGCWRDELLGAFLHAPHTVEALCREASALCTAQLRCTVDAARSQALTIAAMTAMASVRARGRTARARVERALTQAARHGLMLPALRATLAP